VQAVENAVCAVILQKIFTVTIGDRGGPIPIPAIPRSPWSGFRSSDSCGYPSSCATPAPERLRKPPVPGLSKQSAGQRSALATMVD
jgi:hypothetical protein